MEKIDGLVMKHYPTGYGASDFEEARAPKRTASHSENGTHKKRKTESESGEKEKKEKKDKKEKKRKAEDEESPKIKRIRRRRKRRIKALFLSYPLASMSRFSISIAYMYIT